MFKLLRVRLEEILVLNLNGFSSLNVGRGVGLGCRAEPYSINGPGPVLLHSELGLKGLNPGQRANKGFLGGQLDYLWEPLPFPFSRLTHKEEEPSSRREDGLGDCRDRPIDRGRV